VTGWNNKAGTDYESSFNNLGYFFGPFHRAYVLEDYLSTHDSLTFDEVRNLALNIATTDSFGGGGTPWQFVAAEFENAVTGAADADGHPERQAALNLLAGWDGHFVAGGPSQWAFGSNRADAWVLMDAWIREVLRLTFEDELGSETYHEQNTTVLFNVLLHGLPNGSSLTNAYDWFANEDAGAPQTAEEIIVAALDTVLADLGPLPWGTGQRGDIPFVHSMLGVVHTMPFSSRSTFAHVVEYDGSGPVRIESMFALGQSGNILATPAPVLDEHFKSMTDVFDGFGHRPFRLNP
jgi:penicillin amidase